MRYAFAIAAAYLVAVVAVQFAHDIQDRATSCSYATGDAREMALCHLAFEAHGAAGVDWLRSREAMN